MNTLPQDQNAQRQLDRLAAMRHVYSTAKAIQAWYMILSVPAVIVWALLAIWEPALKVYAAAWGLSMFALDIAVLTPRQKILKLQAAKIQELFDCDLLQMDWHSLKANPRPSDEDILRASTIFRQRYKHNPNALAQLSDWYPPAIGALPLHLARIACQRINCWWDGTLRRRYAGFAATTVTVMVVALFVSSLVGGFTVGDLAFTLSTLLPAIAFGVRQYVDNRDAAASSDHLREHAEKLWCDTLEGSVSPQDLPSLSRDLQDEIFDSRRRNPLVFDLLYNRLRSSQEQDMGKIAVILVDEAARKAPAGNAP